MPIIMFAQPPLTRNRYNPDDLPCFPSLLKYTRAGAKVKLFLGFFSAWELLRAGARAGGPRAGGPLAGGPLAGGLAVRWRFAVRWRSAGWRAGGPLAGGPGWLAGWPLAGGR